MIPTRATHKRGDTFDVSGPVTVLDNGAPVGNLTGWQGKCQLRSIVSGALIADLQFTWLDAAAGLCRLRCADTSAWPVGLAELDLQLTTPAGDVISTATTQLQVLKDVTL